MSIMREEMLKKYYNQLKVNGLTEEERKSFVFTVLYFFDNEAITKKERDSLLELIDYKGEYSLIELLENVIKQEDRITKHFDNFALKVIIEHYFLREEISKEDYKRLLELI